MVTKPDPELLLRELASHGTYAASGLTPMDVFREFRAVFLGNSTEEQGKRVLSEIFSWTHVMRTTADPDPYQMAILNGERNIGLRLLSALEIEPPAQRKTTQKQ